MMKPWCCTEFWHFLLDIFHMCRREWVYFSVNTTFTIKVLTGINKDHHHHHPVCRLTLQTIRRSSETSHISSSSWFILRVMVYRLFVKLVLYMELISTCCVQTPHWFTVDCFHINNKNQNKWTTDFDVSPVCVGEEYGIGTQLHSDRRSLEPAALQTHIVPVTMIITAYSSSRPTVEDDDRAIRPLLENELSSGIKLRCSLKTRSHWFQKETS